LQFSMAPASSLSSVRSKVAETLGLSADSNAEKLAGDFTDNELAYNAITTEEMEFQEVAKQQTRRRMLLGAGLLLLVGTAATVGYSMIEQDGEFVSEFGIDLKKKGSNPFKPRAPPPPSPSPPKPSNPPPPSPHPPKHATMLFQEDLALEDAADAEDLEEAEDADTLDMKKKKKKKKDDDAPMPAPTPAA